MRVLLANSGCPVSYQKRGSGPALVLIHGAFSDHRTNWEFVTPFWEPRFTLYAIARRGRGATPDTPGRSLEDDARDAVVLIDSLREPVFLLGHSYGAHVALAVAAAVPALVRKLVLYEPPWTSLIASSVMAAFQVLAAAGEWDRLAVAFFRDVLSVPIDEIEELRRSPLWPPIVADGPASLGDFRALGQYRFQPDDFLSLATPVLLQIGTESPRYLYATDALRAVLPHARIGELRGQAHEAMTTAPRQYAEAVRSFLLDPIRRKASAEFFRAAARIR